MRTKISNSKFRKANETLPLEVKRAEYGDVILHLGGLKWSINVVTCWRLIVGNEVVGFDTADISDYLAKLIGTKLVSIEQQSAYIVDPVFEFSNGYILEVFCTDMEVENWTIWLRNEVFLESFG